MKNLVNQLSGKEALWKGKILTSKEEEIGVEQALYKYLFPIYKHI